MSYDFESSPIKPNSNRDTTTIPTSNQLEDLKRDIYAPKIPGVGKENIEWGPNHDGGKPLRNMPIVVRYDSTDLRIDRGPAYNLNPDRFKHDISAPRASEVTEGAISMKVEQTPKTIIRPNENINSSEVIHNSEGLNTAELKGLKTSIEKITKNSGYTPEKKALIVSPSSQKMYLIQDNSIIQSYQISTSKYGMGTENGSEKTPPGTHIISQKIGDNAQFGAIFEGRVDTGSTAKIFQDTTNIAKDSITSRILRLRGREDSNANSENRAIYIHGTPEEGLIGTPQSHGCIRMRNSDIIELYNIISAGVIVELQNTVQAS